MKNNMKNKLSLIVGLLIALNIKGQLRVVQNGNVAIGINYPNHSLHVYGYSQVFNNNSKEIQFRPYDQSGSNLHSTIGSNLGKIVFWHGAWGYNTLTRGSCVSNSDFRLKNNINLLTNNLGVLKQLTPKSFRYNDSVQPGNKLHYGFIAQEVYAVLPALIDTGRGGMLTMNYEEIIPFLVGAVKEQASTIDSLRSLLQSTTNAKVTSNSNPTEIEDLKKQIQEVKTKLNYFENNCCANLNSYDGSQMVQSDLQPNSIINEVALQNVPNPFENTTTIKFKIPSKFNGNFSIKVFKISGEELMSYKIQKDDKELLINASNLVNGVYNYALIANSDILLMKQMIISR